MLSSEDLNSTLLSCIYSLVYEPTDGAVNPFVKFVSLQESCDDIHIKNIMVVSKLAARKSGKFRREGPFLNI